MNTYLPPGPWRYRPEKHDDWGCVRDADGNPVASTCPPGVGNAFCEAHPTFDDVRWSGPQQARSVAELLIWAERVRPRLIELAAEFRIAGDEWAAVLLETELKEAC